LNFSIAYGKTAFGLAKDFGARAETNNKTHKQKNTSFFIVCIAAVLFVKKKRRPFAKTGSGRADNAGVNSHFVATFESIPSHFVLIHLQHFNINE
jgi:hypothetical protein